MPLRDRRRIAQALREMEEEPLSGDIVPLKGPYAGSYRRPVGSWRVIFAIRWESDAVVVADIARRTSTTY
jgi:mRNA-degrading endonuclease RelE of RelBE toxin-antitoxin system